MSNEDKKIDLESNIFNDKETIINLNEIKEGELDPNYATKQELNAEATIRAEQDQIIIEEFNILKKSQNNKIGRINERLDENNIEINNLGEKVDGHEIKITSNQDKIAEIEECLLERISNLEKENAELNSQLENVDKIIGEKNQEIEKLKEEIEDNGKDIINLKFAMIPEFEISDVITVKDFINNYLKDLVISRMAIRHPEAGYGKDYNLTLIGLDYNDVMQGKDVLVSVKANDEGKLIGETTFEINVSYNYDDVKQEKFIEEFLQSAIPVSLRNVPENATPNYNVPNEIIETKPLKLLLHDKKFKYLTFKIFTEMNAASYWTDFHRSWQFIRDGYVGTGLSTIGGSKIINNIKDLYNNNLGYHHNIFNLIENRINDSGVPCKIVKKWARSTNGAGLIHNLGNLTFNVSNANLENDDILITQIRHYYMMINFEVEMTNGTKKFYRGVTLALTDSLELY